MPGIRVQPDGPPCCSVCRKVIEEWTGGQPRRSRYSPSHSLSLLDSGLSRGPQHHSLQRPTAFPPPHYIPDLPLSSFPLAHITPATLASLQFLRHARHSPTPGPLHVLFPPPALALSPRMTGFSHLLQGFIYMLSSQGPEPPNLKC